MVEENKTKGSIITILNNLSQVAKDIKEKKVQIATIEVNDIKKLDQLGGFASQFKQTLSKKYQRLYAGDSIITKTCDEIITSSTNQINVLNNTQENENFNADEYKQRANNMLQLIEKIIKQVKEDEKFDAELVEDETSLLDSMEKIKDIMNLIENEKNFASEEFKNLYKKALYENLLNNLSKNLNLTPTALIYDFHKHFLLEKVLMNVKDDNKDDFNKIIEKLLALDIMDYYTENDKNYIMKLDVIGKFKKYMGADLVNIMNSLGNELLIDDYKKNFDETKKVLDSISRVINSKEEDKIKKEKLVGLKPNLEDKLKLLIKFLEDVNQLSTISKDGKKHLNLSININAVTEMKRKLLLNLSGYLDGDNSGRNPEKFIEDINLNINYFNKEVFDKI